LPLAKVRLQDLPLQEQAARSGAGAGSSTSTAVNAGRLTAASAGSNQPAAPQMLSSNKFEFPLWKSEAIEGHADQIRGSSAMY